MATDLQVACSVNAPPIKGPRATPVDATPNMSPISFGRASSGAAVATMVNAPFRMPAPPRPETARPIMNIMLVLEAAQMVEPISNTTNAAIKTSLELWYW